MNDNFSIQASDRQISSARQLSDMAKIFQREAEEKAVKRRGAEAQIEASKILEDQRQELEVMRATINALLKHNLEQSHQQALAIQERDKIETERFIKNTRLSKIAAWAGVIGTILAAFGIILQLAS